MSLKAAGRRCVDKQPKPSDARGKHLLSLCVSDLGCHAAFKRPYAAICFEIVLDRPRRVPVSVKCDVSDVSRVPAAVYLHILD